MAGGLVNFAQRYAPDPGGEPGTRDSTNKAVATLQRVTDAVHADADRHPGIQAATLVISRAVSTRLASSTGTMVGWTAWADLLLVGLGS